ncbi:MAG: hypothetical protein HPY83_16400 [Anaerolineae bacterium]|nr:hypothetical protein [Anaerolineae bacterium]
MHMNLAGNVLEDALLQRGGKNLYVVLLCVAGAVLAGVAVAGLGLLAFVVALAVPVGLVVLRDVRYFLWGSLAVITLLPFATLPVDIGVTPTLLEVALLGTTALALVRYVYLRRSRADVTPVGVALLLFIGLMLASFVLGVAHSRPTVTSLRRFADLVLALGFFFVAVNVLEGRLVRQTFRLLLALGAVAALVGVALYMAPRELAEAFLGRLGVVGYPTGNVLRYVEDNPELALRAIGTSVDPNVFGGMLAILGGLAAPQLFVPGPRRDRLFAAGVAGAVALALLLTYSRGSMFGLAMALGMLGLVRHRRILWLLAAGLLLVLVLPMTRDYVQHFIEGLRGQDVATQMRFGEYKDAFLLISRYPWFGVGFTGVPDVDIYLGVSCVYLLIAEEMGLVGVAAFLLALGVFFAYVWPRSRAVRQSDPQLEGLMLGAQTGVVAGMVAGVLDHYLFNLAFPHAATLLWLVVALGVAAALEAEGGRGSLPLPPGDGGVSQELCGAAEGRDGGLPLPLVGGTGADAPAMGHVGSGRSWPPEGAGKLNRRTT